MLHVAALVVSALVGAATSSVRARFVLGSSVAIVLDESSWVSAMPNACVSESDDANPDRQVGIRSAKGLLGVFAERCLRAQRAGTAELDCLAAADVTIAPRRVRAAEFGAPPGRRHRVGRRK